MIERRYNLDEEKKSIVLIEDNQEIRENIVEILELANYLVLPAESGKIGLDLIKEKNPDLIICDDEMPEMTGYSLLRAFKFIGNKYHKPFLFLTGGIDRNQKQNNQISWGFEYLMKPFNVEDLLLIVRNRINGMLPIGCNFPK
jgi:DNA-binding response OmpR family regulator